MKLKLQKRTTNEWTWNILSISLRNDSYLETSQFGFTT